MVSEVVIGLADGDEWTTLSVAQSQTVIERFAEVSREANKWSRMLKRSGRLLIIDPRLVGEIREFLLTECE